MSVAGIESAWSIEQKLPVSSMCQWEPQHLMDRHAKTFVRTRCHPGIANRSGYQGTQDNRGALPEKPRDTLSHPRRASHRQCTLGHTWQASLAKLLLCWAGSFLRSCAYKDSLALRSLQASWKEQGWTCLTFKSGPQRPPPLFTVTGSCKNGRNYWQRHT